MGMQDDDKQMNLEALDELVKEITAEVSDDDARFHAFRQALQEGVDFPVDGFVIGEPVSIIAVDYDGNARRGLTATCRRADGSEHVVAAADVAFPSASNGARTIAAYRRWLDLDPYPIASRATPVRRKPRKAAGGDVDLSQPVALVALSVTKRATRCRFLGSERMVTLKAPRVREVVPGVIVTVMPQKQWRYAGQSHLSGEIQSTRIDAKALDLTPLGLAEMGVWDPEEEYWGEEGEPIEAWAEPIIAHGPRPQFEMEQVLPGADSDDPFDDPISRSYDLMAAGAWAAAETVLMELCQSDLRCLDAHAHLGNLAFDHDPENAIRHYEVGLRIGELSLGDDFDGALVWGLIDNRPFLRCMQGYGLCLWRLGRFGEAEEIFARMLWLNPSDNQGVRFLIDDVKARTTWEESTRLAR